MTSKSPKRCPKGSRKGKNGICKKVIKGGEDDDEYDERLFALNPFNPDRYKSPKKDRGSPKLKPKKSKSRDAGVIGSTLSTAAAVVNSLTSAAVSVPLFALDSVAEVFEQKKAPQRKKSPVLKRTVKKALASTKRRKQPIIKLEARDSDSESLGSSDTEDSLSSSGSDLSGFIDYDNDVPDDSGYRKKLDKFIAKQRGGSRRF